MRKSPAGAGPASTERLIRLPVDRFGISPPRHPGAAERSPGPRGAALREARVCYDHLAGARGVALMRGLAARGWIEDAVAPRLTASGRAGLAAQGIDVAALEAGRRPVCRSCLDWSERASISVGVALLAHALGQRWARREVGRVVRFSPAGAAALGAAFGIAADDP